MSEPSTAQTELATPDPSQYRRPRKRGWGVEIGALVVFLLGMTVFVRHNVKQTGLDRTLTDAVRTSSRKEVVHDLLRHGANANARDLFTGANFKNPMSAAQSAYVNNMAAPADVSAPRGMPVLTSAVISDNAEIAQLLLKADADPNALDSRGMTPLVAAIINDDLPMAKMLIASGASPEGRDFAGQSPLMACAIFDRPEIAKHLLDKGADPSVKSSKQQTALSLAKQTGSNQVEALLKERGAKE